EKLETAVNRLGEIAMHLGKNAMSLQFKTAFAHSLPFLETVGDVIMGWMLLWRASTASEQLNNGAKKKDVVFYQGQIKTADFFINTLIPVTLGKLDAIQGFSSAAIEIDDAAFGGL
ncbi:MAG: acyl-CoA dehydrogenase C-terminal domain-containing protein, partial [Desulfobacteraceae bacterium]|nr:acyl-CoA dehydrogenase C-terminal domain-containing protein [Desulfobacteraceae bacterium]